MGGQTITAEQKAQARALHREGKTCRAIAEIVGISSAAAWNIVTADNNKVRPDAIPARCNVKKADPVVNSATKITIYKQEIPAYAPICATTTKGTYRTNGALSYRGCA